MQTITPKVFPNLATFDGLSERSLREHYDLYTGYVTKYNALVKRFKSLQSNGNIYAGGDTESIKVDITYVLGAIKNHEVFFDILGGDADEPTGELAEELTASFCSIPQFLVDLKQTAITSRGWAWTGYDLDQGYLFNYSGSQQNGMPVWNCVPILAIDLYGHSYFYEFGYNKVAYVETVMKSIHWGRVSKRLAAAKALSKSYQLA